MSARSWRDPWWVPAPLEVGDRVPRHIALVVDPANGGVHPQVAAGVKRAGQLLQDAGYHVEEVQPPGIEDAAQVWRVICIGELLTQLEPAVKGICGARLRRAFEYYHAALPAFGYEAYSNAFAQRRKILRDWLGFFERYDLIVAPVGTEPPLPSDADIASEAQTLACIESFRMTVAVNALSLPAAVVPVGVAEGLPQVVQIIGPPFAEMRCLAVAEAIEAQVQPLTPIDPGSTV
jgi:amidase